MAARVLPCAQHMESELRALSSEEPWEHCPLVLIRVVQNRADCFIILIVARLWEPLLQPAGWVGGPVGQVWITS